MTPDPVAAALREVMAAHDKHWPPPSDAADPSDEWVATEWECRSTFEGEVEAVLHSLAVPHTESEEAAIARSAHLRADGLDEERLARALDLTKDGFWPTAEDHAAAIAKAYREE